jgi:hypothetical protein
MTSTGSELGPGGASITTAPDGRLLIVYHAWTAPAVGYWSGGARSMHTALLEVTAGRHLWVGRRRPAQP